MLEFRGFFYCGGKRMKFKLSYKVASLFLIVFILVCSKPLFANSPLADLKIPSNIGNIKEIFESQKPDLNNQQLVIQIQDAHCNYEAQKNLAQILEYLIIERNLKLILVEGGSGDVSLSFLRSYADKNKREQVADKYLRQGKISGEEYLDIVSDHKLELYGVEDEDLYDANLNSFLEDQTYRDQGSKDVEALQQAVASLKPHMYNPELNNFETKKGSYESKALTLAEYCAYIKGVADKEAVDQKRYSHFSAFVESACMEKTMDFTRAETERNSFIKELAKQIDEGKVKELIEKTQQFKQQKLTDREYYSYLRQAAQGKIDIAKVYPNLNAYITYITVSKDINALDLLKEVGALEDAVRDGLFVNNDERQLSKISKALDTLQGFIKLDLSPDEYAAFRENKSEYSTASWINFLQDNCRRYGLSARPAASQAIDENLEKLQQFYELGIAREAAFVRNLERKLEVSKEKIVVLITGGFHTPGVTNLLKEKGYSYAVVAPVVTERADSSIYFSVLKGERIRRSWDNLDEE
jgi:hypothetical protein